MNLINGLVDDTYGKFTASRGRLDYYLNLSGSSFDLECYFDGELSYKIEVYCLDDIKDLSLDELIFICTTNWEVEK
jgi:hypothetical protein